MHPDINNTTLNIAIDDQDCFFILGLEAVLTDIFTARFPDLTLYFHRLQDGNVKEMDIIFLTLHPGDKIDCMWPALAYRKLRSLVVGFCEHSPTESTDNLLFCLSKALWLDKCSPLTLVVQKLILAWRDVLAGSSDTEMRDCTRCSRLRLTEQQRKIAYYMIRDYSNHDIARLLKINIKTVSVHKYFLMEKMRLRSNQQFINFLRRKNSVAALTLE
ncbi:helix-turn-helix transcriptional regulator [Siccibacter colletis]|uniref:HTH luxR-type domain-containing protein n=1 Tax=Siccibacter colletis TaxID=1505757 RepID=A0ABY6JGU7_9ENTR|nr:helix-turn-helix transcriptional regulator [Siccibacter colletis]UYU32899.1 hypothetical protein KFZ77_05095 [Siccibacter colletis]